jgi:flagellin-specific chaperone FliS
MSEAAQKLAASKLYGGATTPDGKNKIPAYLEQEVLSWSKEKIILKMYDLFIIANKKGDVNKMSRVLIELMGALNFEYEETATRLYRLYEYCQRAIFQKKYDEALSIIQELRDTWSKAFNLEPKEEE